MNGAVPPLTHAPSLPENDYNYSGWGHDFEMNLK